MGHPGCVLRCPGCVLRCPETHTDEPCLGPVILKSTCVVLRSTCVALRSTLLLLELVKLP